MKTKFMNIVILHDGYTITETKSKKLERSSELLTLRLAFGFISKWSYDINVSKYTLETAIAITLHNGLRLSSLYSGMLESTIKL